MVRMLSKYFKMWEGRLGWKEETEKLIDLNNYKKPMYQKPYHQLFPMRDKIAKFVKEQLQTGVIEPKTSEWAILVVFVPNNDGTMRFCV